MLITNLHSYEPAKGHGLKHDPFNAIIAPRPIGWISTRGAAGNINLAPYSFFNAFNYVPPILGFSSTTWKDTVRNIRETGEFVWNLAPVPSSKVSVPRVGESQAVMECKLVEIIQLKTKEGRPVQSWLTIGEVVAVHIDKALLKDGVYQTADAVPIARAGRRGDYFEITADRQFDMPRPD
jgi:flavin reductase (DIM6/NTAB) family NADH-FMN oxidoreductase RutF